MGHHVGSKKEKQEKQNFLISPLSAILCNDIIACSICLVPVLNQFCFNCSRADSAYRRMIDRQRVVRGMPLATNLHINKDISRIDYIENQVTTLGIKGW